MRTDLGHLQYCLIEPFIGRMMIRSSSISHDDDGWVGSSSSEEKDAMRDATEERERKKRGRQKTKTQTSLRSTFFVVVVNWDFFFFPNTTQYNTDPNFLAVQYRLFMLVSNNQPTRRHGGNDNYLHTTI